MGAGGRHDGNVWAQLCQGPQSVEVEVVVQGLRQEHRVHSVGHSGNLTGEQKGRAKAMEVKGGWGEAGLRGPSGRLRKEAAPGGLQRCTV